MQEERDSLVEELEPTTDVDPQSLLSTEEAGNRSGITADLEVIVQAIQAGFSTSRELVDHLGMGYHTVLRRLRELEAKGVVEPTRPKNSSKQSYRVTDETRAEPL